MHARDNLIVVYGGASPDQGPMGDVYILDVESCRWDRPVVKGQAPEPREMHSACMVSDKEMLVVGGRGRSAVMSDAAVLDAVEMKWVRQGNIGGAPQPALVIGRHCITECA